MMRLTDEYCNLQSLQHQHILFYSGYKERDQELTIQNQTMKKMMLQKFTYIQKCII